MNRSITPSPGPAGTFWRPTYTEAEARRLGIVTRGTYRRVTDWARVVVEHHRGMNTPRQLWEPTATQVEGLIGDTVDGAQAELIHLLVRAVDPELDDNQTTLDEARTALDAADQVPRAVSTCETNRTYSGSEAVGVVEGWDRKIEADVRSGRAHHRRTGPALRLIGRWAPWGEAAGFLAFVGYFMNVPLIQPWEDWLGWTFSMTVVVVIILGQAKLVERAAESHNHAREEKAEGNRHEAEAGARRRNWYFLLTSIVAAAITSGMIARGMVALGDADVGTTMVMAFLATVTGLLMPCLAYLASALDGSKVSRERDGLVADLDADLAEWTQITDDCRAALEQVQSSRARLLEKVIPGICVDVQGFVDAVHGPYNFGRLQIGSLAADPPARGGRSVGRGTSGGVVGEISSGIPGARSVDLVALLDRVHRLYSLDAERAVLSQRLIELPRHPWAKAG